MNFSYYQQLALVMTRIASLKMEEKDKFGELSAKTFDIGDIVEWSRWDSESSQWEYNYGIITRISNEIRSNRMVSISIWSMGF